MGAFEWKRWGRYCYFPEAIFEHRLYLCSYAK
nr:MAG TPA: antitermination protein Q [Caudoviricetes sp.]